MNSSTKRKRAPEIPNGHRRLLPPDGGWGWMVLAGTFLVGMLVSVPLNSLGFFLNDLLLLMDTTTTMVSWIGTINYVTATLSAPISTIICETYSCRTAGMVGGILISLGMFLSYFVTKIELLFVTYGFLEGCGISLCRNACFIVLSRYFQRYCGIVTGVMAASLSCGRMIFSPIIQLLIDQFGLRITFLLMSAFLLNICVGAMLFQPVERHMKLVVEDTEDGDEKKPLLERQTNSLAHPRKNRDCREEELQNARTVEDIRGNCCSSRWFRSGPMATLDFSVFRELIFYLICTSTITGSVTLLYSNVFLPPLSIEKGFSAMEAATIQSIESGFEIVGRAATPFVLHFSHLPIHRCFTVMMVGTALGTTGVAMASTFLSLSSFAVLFGIAFGGQVGLVVAVMIHDFGSQKLPSVLSFSYFIQGIATLLLGPVIGLLRDQTGTFRSAFFFVSGLNAFCASCWFLKRFLATETRRESMLRDNNQ